MLLGCPLKVSLLLVLLSFPCAVVCNSPVLPFLNLGEEIQGGDNLRVEKNGRLFGSDDGPSPAIHLPTPLSFGNYTVNTAYVITVMSNGLISFDAEFSGFFPQAFPRQDMIVAPYWDDIDLRQKGVALYTLVTPIHRTLSGLITDVSEYISNSETTLFRAQWILVARWVNVCSYANNICVNGNTFQAVIATDGKRSYAVFTYNCLDLNWIRYGASVGYSANFVLFENHPLANNKTTVNEIACKNNHTSPWSNVIYNINDISDRTILSPSFGSIAGGSGVLVSGPQFNMTDNVRCMFGDQNVNGVVLDNKTVLCTTPQLSRSGAIPVHISQNGAIQEQGAMFYSVPFKDAHTVDVQTDSLLLEIEKVVRVLWPSNLLLPHIESIDTANSIVDIKLYKVDLTSGAQSYEELATIASYLPNSGNAFFMIPRVETNESICQVSIAVEMRNLPIARPQYKFSLWSGVMYLVTTTRDFRERCQQWSDSQSDGLQEELLERVTNDYSCPPTLNRVQSPNSGFELDIKNSELWSTDSYNMLMRNLFNPGTSVCYRQRSGHELTKGSSNQCCYGNIGRLIVGHPGGGNIDLVASEKSVTDNFLQDILPYFWCCKGDFPSCATYYQHRPSDNGARYQPTPPAYAFGDPHLVTLDLHKYTFNGYGEFVLIETMDDSFTLQGRMTTTSSSTLTIPSTGTIFSALAAKEDHSDTAQLQLDPIVGITALVNGERIDFTDITEQEFTNLTLADLGNRTIVATFSSGAFLKVQEQNGIISVLIVSLPSSYQNKTRGLMGNYNGIKSDDLIPRGATESLPLDSTRQVIHEDFGTTWIISNEVDSLFTYKTGENWTTFYQSQYTPLYETVFPNSALKTNAKAVCNNDTFCLYDIAATGSVEVGMTTLIRSQDYDHIVELSAPVVCDPPCQNGACVDHKNTCYCSLGYDGSTCNITVYTECIQYPCLNSGTCQLHAGSYICVCMPGFTGYFCQDSLNPTTIPPGETPNRLLYIIIGAAAGGTLLLLAVCVVLLIVVAMCLRRPKKSRKPKQNFQGKEYSIFPKFNFNQFNYHKFTVQSN